ncbi:hypothetical protein ES332_D10G140100v1 [Gossypium tomentosum]|uniref:Uncharacterized protein n=1 Tax=Gossypium tomentosum TaxID=34277 RepID=A0A5D2J3K8_GOSTO|nr:hypothetical protein ES332_D10G140100v1 [Gossypium tomentosum]
MIPFQKARRRSGDSLPPKTHNLRPNSNRCGVSKNPAFRYSTSLEVRRWLYRGMHGVRRHHAREEWHEGEPVRDSGG